MKTLFFIVLMLLLAIAPFAIGQDKTKPAESMNSNAPPKPLDDAMSSWMIGEWSGTTESSMGTSNDWQKNEMSLDKQFITTNFTSQITKVDPQFLKAQAAQMKMSEQDVDKMMKSSMYKGMGLMTLDPKTGNYIGYWFDSWRGMYKGTGKLEGNKITMNWEGTMGSEVRTIEKDEKGNLIQTFKQNMNGMMMEGKTVSMRKK